LQTGLALSQRLAERPTGVANFVDPSALVTEFAENSVQASAQTVVQVAVSADSQMHFLQLRGNAPISRGKPALSLPTRIDPVWWPR